MRQGVTPPGASGVAPALEFLVAFPKPKRGNTNHPVVCLIHETRPASVLTAATCLIPGNAAEKQRNRGTNHITSIGASAAVEDAHDYKTLETRLLKWTR